MSSATGERQTIRSVPWLAILVVVALLDFIGLGLLIAGVEGALSYTETDLLGSPSRTDLPTDPIVLVWLFYAISALALIGTIVGAVSFRRRRRTTTARSAVRIAATVLFSIQLSACLLVIVLWRFGLPS